MNKKISSVQIVRAIIQLISFITVPALFITIFSSAGELMTSIAGGSFTWADNSGKLILLLGTFIITLVWGRFFCGFICSFGAMQDLFNALGKLIPFKVKIPEKADKYLKLLKYAVLAFALASLCGFSFTEDPFWSPWTVFGIYSSLDGWSSIKYFLTLGGVILLLIITGSLFIERFFCRYFCPLGALFSVVSHFRVYSIKRRPEKCGNCRFCTSKCSMGIPLYRYDEVCSGECINCMKCTSACPNENISADTLPAISGTVAVTAVAGLYFAGVLTDIPDAAEENSVQIQSTTEAADFTDISISTDDSIVSDKGLITDNNTVTDESIVTDNSTVTDDSVVTDNGSVTDDSIITNNGIITDNSAVTDNDIVTDTSGQFADGIYTGTGNGFRGATNVTVTVENGVITDITIDSYKDDNEFFQKAKNRVISAIIESQSTDVDAVSGATFSSNGIKEAVADALGIEFENPNSTQQRGHGGGRSSR